MRKLPLLVHRFQQELKSSPDLSIQFREHLKRFSILSGDEKVEYLYHSLDKIYENLDLSATSCKSGCHYCCFHQIDISKSEFNYITRSIKDIKSLKLNNYPDKNACPFLSSEGKCQIYQIRPLICRITYVKTPVDNCRLESVEKIEHFYQKQASMISLAYLMTEFEDYNLKDTVTD